MSGLKLAFLGVGDVAQRDYLPELHRLGDRVELVAVCGRTEARARAVAEEYGVAAWYADYVQMLDETDAEAVVNLTPMQLHAETNLAAISAGKHIYTEKPLATSLDGARRLRDEARARGLTLVCAPCVMLFPQVRLAFDLVAHGEIGEVYSARGHGHGGVPPWRGYTSDPSQFFALGGGPARDMGVYPLHALTGILGPVRRVSAMASRVSDNFVVPDGPAVGKRVEVEEPDNWNLLLDFGDGRLASVAANNVVVDSRAPQLELHGMEGTIAVDLLDVSAPVEVLRPGRGWESLHVPHARSAGPDHLLGIEHLADCIQLGIEPVLSAEHALHVVEVLDAAERSVAEDRTVQVESMYQRSVRAQGSGG